MAKPDPKPTALTNIYVNTSNREDKTAGTKISKVKDQTGSGKTWPRK